MNLFSNSSLTQSVLVSIVSLEPLKGQVFLVQDLQLAEESLKLVVVQLDPDYDSKIDLDSIK